MEHNAILALIMTVLAGLSTSIGGLIAFMVKKDDMRVLALGLSFSAGVMIYISFMEILPQSIAKFAHNFESHKMAAAVAIAVFFGGALITALIDQLVPEHISHEMMETGHKHSKKSIGKVGVMTALALCIHNFPEGLAVFAAGMDSLAFSIPIAFAIALHNVPEGISVALPIYNATGSRKKAFWWATASGLAEPVGAVAGFILIGSLADGMTLGVLFALIAGIMVFIALDELLPTAQEYGNGHQSILGVFSGMAVMAVSLIFVAPPQ